LLVVLILIICVAAGVILTLNTIQYERVEISPNGTSIEIPTHHREYVGDVSGVKCWKRNYGVLLSYDDSAVNNSINFSDLSIGFDVVEKLIKQNSKTNIDGYEVYMLDSNTLESIVKMDIDGKFYCIFLDDANHDTVVICCNDKDVAVHMAHSIDYK
jgi:hypothetical protein